ncbi:MAG: NAD(P)/FAD-dependent oxidoreductase [Elusimicrobia bacterium]|nr:NAD(P)/FAD-dependent oxidoreductase [Elusimicrobiota bacterium]
MERKTILILGGGVGGQVAANTLATHLNGRHRIVLVDKQREFAFAPSFLWMIVGRRAPRDIQRPMEALLRKGVELVQAKTLRIDPAKKTVETSVGPMSFDHLVISLGADLAPEKVPGFQEAALNLYTMEGSSRIQKSLEGFSGRKVAVLIVSSPFKCPAAPYEAAFLIQDFLSRRGKPAEVCVFTPEPFPMPTAGQKVGEALKAMLESKAIRFNPNHKVTRIEPDGNRLVFENGKSETCDLIIGVPAHQAPKVARESGLTNEAGWIPVDRGTLATKYEGIYAIGDVAAVQIAGGKALPKAGIFAHSQAGVVAANILARLDGRAPDAKFDGKGWCAIELGGGSAAFGDGDFYAEGGPDVRLYEPSRYWHAGKVLFEKWWLAPFGPKRQALRLALNLGAKARGISVSL